MAFGSVRSVRTRGPSPSGSAAASALPARPAGSRASAGAGGGAWPFADSSEVMFRNTTLERVVLTSLSEQCFRSIGRLDRKASRTRHVRLGMNAHINSDLPQALVAVISDEEFGDAALVARREADHRAIDGVLAARVAAEGDELARLSGPAPLLDRLLKPLSDLGTQRFLREA